MSKNQTTKGTDSQPKAPRQPVPEQSTQLDLALPKLSPGALVRLASAGTPPTLRRKAAIRLQRSHGNQFISRWLQAQPGAVLRMTDEERRQVYLEAQTAYETDDFAAALAGFERVIAEGDLPPDALRQVRYNRGMALLRLGRPAEAQPDIDAYIADATPAQQRQVAQEVLDAATALFESGDFAGAVALNSSLLNTVTMSPEAAADLRYNRARALQQLGRNEEAIPDLQAYLETRTDPDARAQAGQALNQAATEMYERGEFAAAADVYYVLLNGGFPDAANRAFLYNYALARQRQGQHADAIALFEQYVAGASDPADRAAAEAQIASSRAALSGEATVGGAPDAQAPDSGTQPVTPPLESGGTGAPDAAAAGPEVAGPGPDAAGAGPGVAGGSPDAAGPGPQTTAERYQRGIDLYDSGDYFGAIYLFDQVRDGTDATPAQRLEAQRRIGMAYHHVGTHTWAARNLRRYLSMPGADPASVREALATSERESARARRMR